MDQTATEAGGAEGAADGVDRRRRGGAARGGRRGGGVVHSRRQDLDRRRRDPRGRSRRESAAGPVDPPRPLDGFSSDEQVYEPSLSPDGTELYFVRGKAGGWLTYLSAIAGTTRGRSLRRSMR